MEWTSSKEQGEQSFLEMWDRNTKGRQLLLLLCSQGWWLLLRMGRGNFVDQVLGVNMQNHHLWVVETHVPLCLGLCKPCTNSCFPLTWSLQLIHWCWSPVIKPEAPAGVVMVGLEGHPMGLATAPAPHGKEHLATWQPP